MVTDRKLICSNGSTSLDLTSKPYVLKETEGFDNVTVTNVVSQGFDQEGATLVNSYVTPRDLKIKGYIQAATTEQMQMMHDRLLNLFLPQRDININHYYGGKNRVIVARVEKTPKFKFSAVSTVQEYEISLRAPKPYWQDENETAVYIANNVGNFHFPLIIPENEGVIFGLKSSTLIADVYNYSSVRVGMRFIFIAKGTVINPQLFNINTREFMQINVTMKAGEQIEIITGDEKTVNKTADGVTVDFIGHVDIEGGGNTFLELEPGDNLFRYGAEAGEDLLETRIYYYNKYPGV